MIRATRILPKSVWAPAVARRSISSALPEENVPKEMNLQQNLREKAIADAIAKEEEIIVKEKMLRELTEKAKSQISSLNSSDHEAIIDRVQRLQKQMSLFKNQEKIQQLDSEIQQFLDKSLKLSNAKDSGSEKNPFGLSSSSKSSQNSSQRIYTTGNSHYLKHYPNLKATPDYKPYSEQELFLRHLSHLRLSGSLGSLLKNVYKAQDDVHNPAKIEDVTIASLLAAGCHLGHSKAMFRPSTQPFIYGEYDGIHLIDLNQTLSSLRQACRVVHGVAKKGGLILYVGTLKNQEQRDALENAAKRSGGYYVSHRWIPGTITNFTEVSNKVEGNQKIEVDLGDSSTSRVIGSSDSSIIKPDLIVLLNPVENRNCITESIRLRIPTIGLCDTDMEPSLLTYPIPCNDDSMRSCSLVLGALSHSAKKGMEERRQAFNFYKSSGRKASRNQMK